MKILRNKTYKELLEYKSKYFDLLWKPLQGAFEKVSDDELLRDNANLHAELMEAWDNATWWHNRYNSEYNTAKAKKESIKKAIDILLTWGEALNPEFQKAMLEALEYKK